MKKRGIGYACAWLGTNYHFGHEDASTCRMEATPDGRLEVGIGACELGQGLPTTLAMITSEVFGGLALGEIDVLTPDTGRTPSGGGTGASRQTTVSGSAVYEAAVKLRDLLIAAASELLDASPDDIEPRQGRIVARSSGRSVTLAEAVRECLNMGIEPVVEATFKAPMTSELNDVGQGLPVNQFSYVTQIAEVEVDTETGEVTVLKMTSIHDAGMIINPVGAEGQVTGGCVMGLGMALMEDLVLQDGAPVSSSLANYHIPTVADAPPVEAVFVQSDAAWGPMHVKGLAEAPVVPPPAAVVNAIYNAVGVRITELPATPERVWKALRAK